jgi:GrpB-like predicted nucleotidyltransferase (UPF0157 family)
VKKDLYVKCPGCDIEMRIDCETGEVISHGKKEQSSGIDFGDALAAEKNRKQELEDLFKAAADKAQSKPDEDKDGFDDDKWR